MKKSVSIFGATGSVGSQAASILQNDLDSFEIETLTAHSNVDDLVDLVTRLNAKHCVIVDDDKLNELKSKISNPNVICEAGQSALMAAANWPVDISIQSIVGFGGVETSIAAAQHAGMLALANKEALVCAGPLLKAVCKQHGTKLIPLDSEHSAIYQCMDEGRAEISKIILTASGGPFRKHSMEDLRNVTLQDASNHPNWDMGQRITIDSASMFNKAMEMIEAQMLFDVRPDQIEVVVHPQSALHSAVELEDGAIMAHLGPTDMRAPIGYALYYPKRKDVVGKKLDLTAMARLDFEKPDKMRFPAISLAEQAMDIGKQAGLVLNAAKEVGLDEFIAGRIQFNQMASCVAHSLEIYAKSNAKALNTLQDLVQMNEEYRQVAQEYLRQ